MSSRTSLRFSVATSVKRRAAVLGALLAIALIAASCASTCCRDSCDADATGAPIVVYSDMLNPPFSSWDESGRAVGLEVDIVADAARSLGRPVEWIEKPFRDLLPGVANGKADIAASTIGITEERAKTVTFSRPYFETEIVALVRARENEPSTLQELAEVRIGAGATTTSESAVEKRFPRAELVTSVADGDSMRAMLERGDVDAWVLDRTAAERAIEENFDARASTPSTPEIRIAEPGALASESYGFAFARPADEALLDAVNHAILSRR